MGATRRRSGRRRARRSILHGDAATSSMAGSCASARCFRAAQDQTSASSASSGSSATRSSRRACRRARGGGWWSAMAVDSPAFWAEHGPTSRSAGRRVRRGLLGAGIVRAGPPADPLSRGRRVECSRRARTRDSPSEVWAEASSRRTSQCSRSPRIGRRDLLRGRPASHRLDPRSAAGPRTVPEARAGACSSTSTAARARSGSSPTI